MISDIMCDAIHEIETWQRDCPEWYDGIADHIELVKKVMASLMNRLDEVPVEFRPNLAETLSPEQQEWWRVTCEANIARWAERLRFLEPISAEKLVGQLDDAIKRQEALLQEPTNTEDDDGLRSAARP